MDHDPNATQRYLDALVADLETAKAEVARLYSRWQQLDQIAK